MAGMDKKLVMLIDGGISNNCTTGNSKKHYDKEFDVISRSL